MHFLRLKKQTFFHFAKLVSDQETLRKIFTDTDPKYVDTKNHWIELYKAEKQKNSDDMKKLQDALAQHYRTGNLAKYRCWNCGTKFQAFEKEEHICPKCHTNLGKET